jgi:hypothetical protein
MGVPGVVGCVANSLAPPAKEESDVKGKAGNQLQQENNKKPFCDRMAWSQYTAFASF